MRKILLFLAVASLNVTIGAGLECGLLPKIQELFLERHFLYRTFTNDLKKRTVEQYVKHLDPSKTHFLESDLSELREELNKELEAAKSGDCNPLQTVQAKLISRAAENEAFVKNFLGDKYQLDENTELVLDSRKRNYSKTVEEKQELLKKMIHFQVSNLLLTKIKLPEAKKQLIHRYELATKHFKEQKLASIIAYFADAFSTSLDPHSDFLSPEDAEDFQIQMHLSLEGIGAALRYQDGFTVIENLIKGGSAYKSKTLKPKDKIISVAQEGGSPVSVIDMELRDVVKLIRGKKGTKVTLTILRQGDETSTFQTTLVREKIDLEDQSAKITYHKELVNGKTLQVGVIDLPSFYGTGSDEGKSSSSDVKKLLQEAVSKKVDGLVLNLSKNGGGLLEEAVKISGLFIQKGGVVATKDTSTTINILKDTDDKLVYRGPLVVLTSRISASASEILAGALQDYRRAVIVGGDHTFGKGTVQSLMNLPPGWGGMKVTMGMFFIPGGKSTQALGVPSDIILPSLMNNDEIGEITLDYALPNQVIPPFVSNDANVSDKNVRWTPIDPQGLKQMVKNSRERVAKDPDFADIQKQFEKLKKNNGIVKLAELRKESSEKEKKSAKKKTKKSDADKSEDESDDSALKDDAEFEDGKGPYTREAIRVLIDLVQLQS